MASRLADIGIQSLEDLLFHFPYRYQDRTRITPIAGLRDRLDAMVEGEVRAAAVTSGRRRSLLVKVEDSTGLLTLRFFHFRQAQVSQFRQGAVIPTFGTPRRVGGGIDMIHPEYRLGEARACRGSADAHLPYSQRMGQSTWRKLCRQALSILENNPPVDLLHDIIEDRITLAAAIAFLHNPPPNAELSRSGWQPSRPAAVSAGELIAHQLTVQACETVRDGIKPRQYPASSMAEQFLKSLPFTQRPHRTALRKNSLQIWRRICPC